MTCKMGLAVVLKGFWKCNDEMASQVQIHHMDPGGGCVFPCLLMDRDVGGEEGQVGQCSQESCAVGGGEAS